MTRLLYLCWENGKRSPVAELWTRVMIEEYGINGLEVSSAGLSKPTRKGIISPLRDSLQRITGSEFPALPYRFIRGYNHIPRGVRRAELESLNEQDIVLCMEKAQVNSGKKGLE